MASSTLPTKTEFLTTHIKTLSLSDLPHSDNDEDSQKCIICDEFYSADVLTALPFATLKEDPIQLPCNHIFGHECLSAWLSTSGANSCPACRQALFVKETATTGDSCDDQSGVRYLAGLEELNGASLRSLVAAKWNGVEEQRVWISWDVESMVKRLMGLWVRYGGVLGSCVFWDGRIDAFGVEKLVESCWEGDVLKNDVDPVFVAIWEKLRCREGSEVEVGKLYGELLIVGAVVKGERWDKKERRIFEACLKGMVEYERRLGELDFLDEGIEMD